MLEEWRSGRDSVGRTHEAHWKILLEGTKVCSASQSLKAYAILWKKWYMVMSEMVRQCRLDATARWYQGTD